MSVSLGVHCDLPSSELPVFPHYHRHIVISLKYTVGYNKPCSKHINIVFARHLWECDASISLTVCDS